MCIPNNACVLTETKNNKLKGKKKSVLIVRFLQAGSAVAT